MADISVSRGACATLESLYRAKHESSAGAWIERRGRIRNGRNFAELAPHTSGGGETKLLRPVCPAAYFSFYASNMYKEKKRERRGRCHSEINRPLDPGSELGPFIHRMSVN